jgi:hypothetical protein
MCIYAPPTEQLWHGFPTTPSGTLCKARCYYVRTASSSYSSSSSSLKSCKVGTAAEGCIRFNTNRQKSIPSCVSVRHMIRQAACEGRERERERARRRKHEKIRLQQISETLRRLLLASYRRRSRLQHYIPFVFALTLSLSPFNIVDWPIGTHSFFVP